MEIQKLFCPSLMKVYRSRNEMTKNRTGRRQIRKITSDSRTAREGDLFVCIRGMETDGHFYLVQALEQGVEAVLVEESFLYSQRQCASSLEPLLRANVDIWTAKDTRSALAWMAKVFYGCPAGELFTVGITGTKGKTTTAYMTRAILEEAGIPTGLIGTVEVDTKKRKIPAEHTTPDALNLHRYLREMCDAGCQAVVMEVSSQALMLQRTEGLVFDVGVFLNLGNDHIGKKEHKNFEDYKYWKKQLFSNCIYGIFNGDDPFAGEMAKAGDCGRQMFGIQKMQDKKGAAKEALFMTGRRPGIGKGAGALPGISYELWEQNRMAGRVTLPFPGVFNLSNSLAAAAVGRRAGVSNHDICRALQKVCVPGRMESIRLPLGGVCVIDYAHNAMSLQSVLKALRMQRPKKLKVLFGCGGNRAKDRRLEMGKVAAQYADETIITSDNPRWEEPESIMEDIRKGFEEVPHGTKRCWMIADRKEAIVYGCQHTRSGEVLVIAGKGHESYQEIRGVKYQMHDRMLVESWMEGCSERTRNRIFE